VRHLIHAGQVLGLCRRAGVHAGDHRENFSQLSPGLASLAWDDVLRRVSHAILEPGGTSAGGVWAGTMVVRPMPAGGCRRRS